MSEVTQVVKCDFVVTSSTTSFKKYLRVLLANHGNEHGNCVDGAVLSVLIMKVSSNKTTRNPFIWPISEIFVDSNRLSLRRGWIVLVPHNLPPTKYSSPREKLTLAERVDTNTGRVSKNEGQKTSSSLGSIIKSMGH